MRENRYDVFSINNNQNIDFNVIFIHGLGDDKYTTWKNSNNESWQNWFAEDYNAPVWTIRYSTK